MEWGEPTNGSMARRHSSQSQLYSFFGVVDQTLTHFFWSTGWEVISKFPSHSSLVFSLMMTWFLANVYLEFISFIPQANVLVSLH